MGKRIMLAIGLLPFAAFAQINCDGDRYYEKIFSQVNTTSDVVYGNNLDIGGGNMDLKVDIYEPDGDTLPTRPLIIWAHGGTFLGGSKTDNDMVKLCNRFARRGYVTASIDYRLSLPSALISKKAMTEAVWRGMQDGKAAVRFFRDDAANSNTYKIDPDHIYFGGSSAGGFIALQMAYTDKQSEIPPEINTGQLGDLEGDSGNPGFSSEVRAIINLCGAMGDVDHMESAGDEPVLNMHGTDDETVPYGTEVLTLAIIPLGEVSGGHSINKRADALGMKNSFYAFKGADHVPYAHSDAYMDTTENFIRDFLYEDLGCTEIFAGMHNPANGSQQVRIFPNPASGSMIIENLSPGLYLSVRLMDITGKPLSDLHTGVASITLTRDDLPDGIYLLQLQVGSHPPAYRKVMFY